MKRIFIVLGVLTIGVNSVKGVKFSTFFSHFFSLESFIFLIELYLDNDDEFQKNNRIWDA